MNYKWILDTGATDHMVCSVHSLTETTASASRFVKLPNGTLTEVTHVGSIRLSDSYHFEECSMRAVFCIQSNFNQLLKIVRCNLILLSGVCFLQDLRL